MNGITLTMDAIYAHVGERRASDPDLAVTKAADREAKKTAREAAVDVLLKSPWARQSLASS